MSVRILKAAGGIGATAAVIAAAIALSGGSSSPNNASVANAAPTASAAPSTTVPQQAPDRTGQAPGRGAVPRGGPGGFGTPVTGATAAKVKAAATAKYPGTVERVVQLPDGSYEAHVITSSGEQHVAVSKDFTVTGVQSGGPGGPPVGADGSATAPGTPA